MFSDIVMFSDVVMFCDIVMLCDNLQMVPMYGRTMQHCDHAGCREFSKATSVSASLKVSSLAATRITEMPATKNVGMHLCSLTSDRQTQ